MNGRTNAAVGGVQLPELSNPAGAANIQRGYQAINGEGEVVTGTAEVRELATCRVSVNNDMSVTLYCYGRSYGANRFSTAGTYDVPIIKNSIALLYTATYSQKSFLGEVKKLSVDRLDDDFQLVEVSGDCTIEID